MGYWLRRREILLPTLRCWLLIIAALVLLFGVVLHRVHGFLAQEQPAPGADLLVVEGWLSESALDQALSAYLEGNYRMIVTTGGPIETWTSLHGFETFAERAAAYLVAQGLEADRVEVLPAPASAQDRTFLSAVVLREWLEGQRPGYTVVDLFSSGTHARRSARLFRLALAPDTAVGVRAAEPQGYDPANWWRSSEGAKSVMGETISLAWTTCCFRPPRQGSHEERWGIPKTEAD